MKVLVPEVAVGLDAYFSEGEDAALRRAFARRVGDAAPELTIYQRALDARHQRPKYVYTVLVDLPAPRAQELVAANRARPFVDAPAPMWRLPRAPDGPPPVVIGAGPAGLFAALTLAEAGLRPVIVERGRPVAVRSKDVSRLYGKGELNVDSNVCFGEGGAGTYSDGKLYTRVGDARVRRVLEVLAAHSGRQRILVDARPHLGTDKLVLLLERLRARLESLGAVFRFDSAVESFRAKDGALRSVTLRDGEILDARWAVVATGHSAVSVWHALQHAGAHLEARPFAVGFRVEHPQPLIDELRYGRAATQYDLPAADYRLTYNEREGAGRGVYSFCMCPGGVVVATPTVPGELCINGMSHAARSGRFANSALVITVGPDDFGVGLWDGVAFQREVERKAYAAGGGDFVAPASTLVELLRGQASKPLGATSYRRGIVPADLAALYPEPITRALRTALERFNRSMPGFVSDEAKLIGVETRTASPIRVLRGPSHEAQGIAGLYPAGEGMGYGGGIMSAAVDGVRVAESLLEGLGAVASAGESGAQNP